MNLSILFWNYQGVSSPSFRRAFKSLISTYKVDMVAVLEPKVSGLQADKFIKLSGFDRSQRVEAVGFSGGIWLLWNERITVDIVENHKQFILFKVINMNGGWSWITAVYASPVNALRSQLWIELGRLSKYIQGPWILRGDFNNILHVEEKQWGSSRRTGVSNRFSNWFHAARMIDLGFKGPRFTWSKGRLAKRLDRAICNDE